MKENKLIKNMEYIMAFISECNSAITKEDIKSIKKDDLKLAYGGDGICYKLGNRSFTALPEGEKRITV